MSNALRNTRKGGGAWHKLLAALAVAATALGLALACSTPSFQFAPTPVSMPDASVDSTAPECDADSADCGVDADVDAGSACPNGCANDHGSTRCAAGQCEPICAAGFADCDGDPSNGCETDLGTEDNCGACGSACKLGHATAECDNELCTVGLCDPGFADCDGDPKNGCEADLSQPETCGACDVQCNANGGVATCTAGLCGITCSGSNADCVNGLSDGCETDTSLNVLHCGSCANACPATAGTPSCVEGKCGLSNCTSPLADCNGDALSPTGNGCETNTSTDAANCGGCGVQCYFPNASAQCIGKVCQLGTCAAGYADCTVETGCETKLGTTSNCLACADACNNDHGTAACVTQGCVPTCARDWGDCDKNPNNGCETPLTTLTDCGACGAVCAFAHAAASCATGTCTQGACDAGWADCTSAPGCETESSCPTGGGGAGGGGSGGASGSSGAGGSGGAGGSFCSQAGFAFCDDFEDGNASGWLPSGGTWAVTTDGSFVYQGGNGSFQSTAGSTTWTDLSLQARVKLLSFGGTSASYRAGLVARYNGSSNDYVVALDATGSLVLLHGMSAVSGASGTCSSIFVGSVIGTWYTLGISATGPSGNVSLKTYLNGVLEHNCVTTSSTSANGEIGLVTVGTGTKASFDDVNVTVP
jgi:hypothetical protein